ncbi:hypothetical protein [Roseivirga thermotolerans]|uniref:hypothetical protein n=1 Tax=Roseivirga thermotolerans TaxID=1758176 RepID=UPI00273E59E6|nr:hypothetical protein [Roseivirga thermotolerans]
MKYFIVIPILSVVLLGCTTPQKEPDSSKRMVESEPKKEEPITRVLAEMPDYYFQFSSLELNQHLKDLDLRVFKHYGEFYTDDFSIYKLHRLDYLVESYFIEDINLYFIDSLLVKIQVYLREDKTQEFLNRYGMAKIYITDYHNKKLLESERVLSYQKGKYRINENLDHYILRWKADSMDIEYRVNKKPDSIKIQAANNTTLLDDNRKRYKLTFQTADYDHQMAWIKWESYKESRGLVAEPAEEQ